jgi:hypothetical protein
LFRRNDERKNTSALQKCFFVPTNKKNGSDIQNRS